MNKAQRRIIGIAVPVLILIVTLFIAGEVARGGTYRSSPFDWSETWLIWFVSVILIAGFEYWFLRDRNK